MADTLVDTDPRQWPQPDPAREPRPIAVLFPGQGSQHAGMATGLYGHEPVFTATVDEVLGLMGADGDAIRDDWLSDDPAIDVDDVRRAQPLLFAIDYALGALLLSWGVQPVAMLGHSAGEVVAATMSDVFSLTDAVGAQLDRVHEATHIPAGGMLAIAASEAELRPYLVGDVAIAAVNAGRQTMLAGTVEPLATVRKRLQEADFTVAVVPATSPFHSGAMAPVVAATERALADIALRPPIRIVYSGYTGRIMEAADATAPHFWARQVTDTVYFGPALDRLLADHRALLVEAGPGQTLTSFARRHPAVRRGESTVAPMLPAGPGANQRAHVLGVAALLWTEGHELALDRLVPLWESVGTGVSVTNT